ncbi:MAG TPA: S-layer homology domain-containing protein, partial [Candidatus Absconditabacterales bacterium]|nr:S-layer homology domain-containing protein [Candidatus Absconditabacterales bacterium]
MKKTIYGLFLLITLFAFSTTTTQAANATVSFTILAATGTETSGNNIHANGFSQEFVDAYNFAFERGITTQKTIQDADIRGKLTRAHMAKMMVTYAMESMSGNKDSTHQCKFDDIKDQTQEIKSYIKTACQLGIMGVGITKFNPNGIVTRAEFGTVLSRIVYGNTYNNGEFYYSNHLQALKENGIIQDDTPDLEEIRGYVMLMIMR